MARGGSERYQWRANETRRQQERATGMAGARGDPQMTGARSRRRSRQAAGRVRSVRFGLTEEEYEEVGTAAADAGLAKGAYAAQATLAAAGACSARRGFSVPAGADRTDPRGRAGPPD